MSKVLKGITRATSIGKMSLLPMIGAAFGPEGALVGSTVAGLGSGQPLGKALLSGAISGLTAGMSGGQGIGAAFGGSDTFLGNMLNKVQGTFADTGLGRLLGAVNPNTGISWNSARIPESSFTSAASSAASAAASSGTGFKARAAQGATQAAGQGAGQAASSPGLLDNLLGSVGLETPSLNQLTKLLDVVGAVTGESNKVAGGESQEEILAQRRAKEAQDAAYSQSMIDAMNSGPGQYTQAQLSPEDYMAYAFRPGNAQLVSYAAPTTSQTPQLAKGGSVPQDDVYGRMDPNLKQLFDNMATERDVSSMNMPTGDALRLLEAIQAQDAVEKGDRALIKDKPKKAKGGLPPFLMAPEVTQGGAGRMYEGEGGGQDDTLDTGNALLSPNEYVVQADVVAALGDGNPKVGAKKLDEMGINVRKHKAKGKSSQRAKNPLNYMPKRRDGRKARSVNI